LKTHLKSFTMDLMRLNN